MRQTPNGHVGSGRPGATFMDQVEAALRAGTQVAVSLAPSFPAAFYPLPAGDVFALIKARGFAFVEETAAVLPGLMEERRRLVEQSDRPYIASSCPAVIALIRKQYPHLLSWIFPQPSPMVLHGRSLKKRCGSATKVLFVGPCVVKRLEAARHRDAIDWVVTLREFKGWLLQARVLVQPELPARPPARNMDVARVAVLAVHASGGKELREVLGRLPFDSPAPFIEALACKGGCLNGPGMPQGLDLAARRAAVLAYALSQNEGGGSRDDQEGKGAATGLLGAT